MTLKRLKVIGIFDRQDIEFNLEKSPTFLVGPNGTGKSTALKVIYFIISAQWRRLEDLPFNAVEATFDEEGIIFDKADFTKIYRIRELLHRSTRRNQRGGKFEFPENWFDTKSILEGKSSNSRSSRKVAPTSAIDAFEDGYEWLAILHNTVEKETRGRTLYFPTYRRVERDLGELLAADEDPFNDEPSITPVIENRFDSVGEVVGFGGQDIRALLSDTASRIEVLARQALNEHSVRFLEALARKRTGKTKHARELVKSNARMDRLLDRLSSFSPVGVDMEAIRSAINDLRNKLSRSNVGRLTQQEDVLLFYVSEMMDLLDRIDKLTAPLARFTQIIEKYLHPVKSARLRNVDNRVLIKDRSGNEIEIDQLSSGEKQIFAFFAFLFLKTGTNPKYIIVDEPELSLSVSWQKTLISDMMKVSPSAIVLAATHSPFIFGDFSLENVVSLGEL